jgi:hypothetical protein
VPRVADAAPPRVAAGPWWRAGFDAGFRGQACTPPHQEEDARAFADGWEWGRVERELYQLRQKARRGRDRVRVSGPDAHSSRQDDVVACQESAK